MGTNGGTNVAASVGTGIPGPAPGTVTPWSIQASASQIPSVGGPPGLIYMGADNRPFPPNASAQANQVGPAIALGVLGESAGFFFT